MLTSSGGRSMLTGGKINQNLADVICERSLHDWIMDIGAKCW